MMASNQAHIETSPFPQMPAVARILSRYDRADLTAFITVAIDLLDAMDGDPDLENGDEDRCQAGDDGCGPYHWNGIHWGCRDDQNYVAAVYGIDQTEGPINFGGIPLRR